MNQLKKLFNYQGQQVRTIIKDGEPWFVAKDVCEILEIKNHSDAVSRLNNKQKSVLGIADPHGRMQDTAVINESGVYKLVFRSNKPEAERFTDWIVEEVLPSIRKTGSYSIQQPVALEDLIIMQAQSVKELKAKVSHLDETVTTMQETFLQRDEDWRKSINTMLNRAAFKLGGQYRDLRNHSYDLLEERGHCNLNIRLANLKERLKDEGATKTRINQTTKMDVIESEPRLKEIYSTIVKELSIGSTKAV